MWLYRVCSITYSDKTEQEAALNAEGANGWILCAIVSTTPDSPEAGITTQEIIFRKPI